MRSTAGPFVSSSNIPDRAQAYAPRLFGSDRTPTDYAALEARWIDRTLVGYAGLR
jgi:hypothetical protein